MASDQGVVEEGGAAFRGRPSSPWRKRAPCLAAAGMLGPLGKWSRLEKRVDRGSDVGGFWESQRPVQTVVQAGLVMGRGRLSGPADHLVSLFLMLGGQGE